MQNLLSVVRAYEDKTITDHTLRAQIRPVNLSTVGTAPTHYGAFKKAVLKAMYLFMVKDIPNINKLDPDQIRGLFYNRLRTEVSSSGYGFALGTRSRRSICHCMILQFSSDKTDVERISLYAGTYTNKEITGDENDTYRSTAEEIYLGKIFNELKVLNSMWKYLAENSLPITPTSSPEQSRYVDLLLNYTSLNFNSKT